MDCSLPGSSVNGIFQAIVLGWIAISFSRGASWPRDQTRVSRTVDRCFTVWATREVCIVACIVVCSFCPRQATATVFYLSISPCYLLDLGLVVVIITLTAESKDDLKSLLMKVKEERGKAGLKLNIQKTKIMMASITSLHGKQMEKRWKQWQSLFSWARKSLQMLTAAMKLEDACSLEQKLWQT